MQFTQPWAANPNPVGLQQQQKKICSWQGFRSAVFRQGHPRMKCHACTNFIQSFSNNWTYKKIIRTGLSEPYAFSANNTSKKQWPQGCCTGKAALSWCAEISGESSYPFFVTALYYQLGETIVFTLWQSLRFQIWCSRLRYSSHTQKGDPYHTNFQMMMLFLIWIPFRIFEEGENTLLNCKSGVSIPPRVVENGGPCKRHRGQLRESCLENHQRTGAKHSIPRCLSRP